MEHSSEGKSSTKTGILAELGVGGASSCWNPTGAASTLHMFAVEVRQQPIARTIAIAVERWKQVVELGNFIAATPCA